MTPFFPGSVTSDGNENCSTTSYQVGPNFGRAHNLSALIARAEFGPVVTSRVNQTCHFVIYIVVNIPELDKCGQ